MAKGKSVVLGALPLLLGALACNRSPPTRLMSDTLFGVRVGMRRSEVQSRFAPRGTGRWLELESVAGESRLRWVGAAPSSAPRSLEVVIGANDLVRELVMELSPDDARAAIATLGTAPPTELVRLRGPSGDVVIAPGIAAWTIRLASRSAG